MSGRLTSDRYPYVPISLNIRGWERDLQAFPDTGFDGDIAIPASLASPDESPDGYLPFGLADGSEGLAPYYLGVVSVGALGTCSALVIVVGSQPLVGRGITDHFVITLVRGQQLIVEP